MGRITGHSFHHPWPHRIQIGPNWDLSEALNNRYRLPAPSASSAPGHFGVLLIKMHLLAFVVVAIKWIIRPKTKKNLFSCSLSKAQVPIWPYLNSLLLVV